MNRQMTASTIKKAFNLWSRVVPLKFKQTKFQNSNIKISFLVGDHGDEAPFKNAGDEEDEQQLAHSKEYPSGIIHFFDGLEWSVGSLKGEGKFIYFLIFNLFKYLNMCFIHSNSKR